MTQQNAPELELIREQTMEERVEQLEQQVAHLLHQVVDLKYGPDEE